MRPASLALPALALLLLLPTAQAQMPMQTPFTLTSAVPADAIGPGESTTVRFEAVRSCPTGAAVLPAGVLLIERPTSPVFTITGALSLPVPEHQCVPSSNQPLTFQLQVHAPDPLPYGMMDSINVRARVSQSAPGHSDTQEAAISFIVPLKPQEPAGETYIGPVESSPVLAPGVVLAALGALAARRRAA